jgi:hypothetical protein
MEKDAAGCPSLPTHTGSRTPAQAVPRQPPTLLPVRFGGGRQKRGLTATALTAHPMCVAVPRGVKRAVARPAGSRAAEFQEME